MQIKVVKYKYKLPFIHKVAFKCLFIDLSSVAPQEQISMKMA